MWPWGHLAVAYLIYSAFSRTRFDVPPRAGAAFVVAVGSQSPDLIDKPLAWTLTLLPSGRSLAHSVFFAGLVLLIARELGRRYNRPTLAVAFGIGYLSHLVTDAVSPLWAGDHASLAYLVWPLLPMHDSPTPGIIWYILSQEWTPYASVQFALFVVACGVWVFDGTPGMGVARRVLPQSVQDVE